MLSEYPRMQSGRLPILSELRDQGIFVTCYAIWNIVHRGVHPYRWTVYRLF
jgi:hypothetical protein